MSKTVMVKPQKSKTWPIRSERSLELFEEAIKYVPTGVPDAFRSSTVYQPYPLFVEKGAGSKIYDVDGNEYVDYLMAAGPLILGHSPPQVMEAIKEQLQRGTAFFF